MTINGEIDRAMSLIRLGALDGDDAIVDQLVDALGSEAVACLGRVHGNGERSRYMQAVDMANIVKGYRQWIRAAERGQPGPGARFGFRDEGGTVAERWRRFLLARREPGWLREQYATTADEIAEALRTEIHGELTGIAAAAGVRDERERTRLARTALDRTLALAREWEEIAAVCREDFAHDTDPALAGER